MPSDIEVKETVDAGCTRCGGLTRYDKSDQGDTWPWICENGCQPDETGYPGGSVKTYEPLFLFLDSIPPLSIDEAQALMGQE